MSGTAWRSALAGLVGLVGLVGCGPAEVPYDPVLARSLYVTGGCVPCHGDEGRGDGALAPTLMPRPRDFHNAAAFKYGRDVDRVAHTIYSGLTAHPTPMPASSHLSLEERRQLARYVLSLATPVDE